MNKMNVWKPLTGIVIVMTLLISGCLPSIHPLYTPDTVVKEDRLLGKWIDQDKDVIVIERYKPGILNNFPKELDPSKHVIYKFSVNMDREDGAEYLAVVVKVGRLLYFDLYPLGSNEECNYMHFYSYIPTHTFVRLEVNGDGLSLYEFDSEKINELIQQNKVRIRHEKTSEYLVLTAQAEELQKFILKFGMQADLYSDSDIYTRTQ